MSSPGTTGSAAGDTPAAEAPTRPIGEVIFAAAVVALGAYALVNAGTINVPLTAGAMGPRAMPYLVGGLLVLSGLAVLLTLLRGKHGAAEEGEDVDPKAHTDWLTVGLLVAIIVAHIALIRPLGWPIAATVLFGGTAITLGARPVWRAIALGFVVAIVIQIAMAGGLGVSLPAGPGLERLAILRG